MKKKIQSTTKGKKKTKQSSSAEFMIKPLSKTFFLFLTYTCSPQDWGVSWEKGGLKPYRSPLSTKTLLDLKRWPTVSIVI